MRGWHGHRHQHSLASKGIKTTTLKALDKLEEKRDNLNYSKEEFYDALDKFYAIEDIGWVRDEYGNSFRDHVLEGDIDFADKFNAYYNIRHPFVKGDKVWDNRIETQFHIISPVSKHYYDGFYFDEHGVKKEGRATYETLERDDMFKSNGILDTVVSAMIPYMMKGMGGSKEAKK